MRTKPILRLGLILFTVWGMALLLGACQPLGERSEHANPDWSRGLRLGRASVNDAVALLPAPGGERLYLAWVTRRHYDGRELLHITQREASGRLVSEREVEEIEVYHPVSVRLAPAGGLLHLFWVDGPASERTLFHALVDGRGWLHKEPQPLSPSGLSVNGYALASQPDGSIALVMSASEGAKAGLFLVRLAEDGGILLASTPLGAAGVDPALQGDAAGTLHLLWAEELTYGERALYYGTIASPSYVLASPTRLASFPAGLGLVNHPPALALVGEQVYAFWSIERRGGGLTAPMANTFYTVFPLGKPEEALAPRQVIIPPWNHPLYTEVKSALPIRHLASIGHGEEASDFIYFPYTPEGLQGEELPVAFAVEVVGRTKRIVQVIMTYWRGGGELFGYQIAGQTASASSHPVLARDDQGNLHLAWLDTAGFGNYDVYYASTSPAARAYLNRWTLSDLATRLLNFLWGVVQAMGFMPVILAWGFLPLVIIVVYVLFVPEADLTQRTSLAVLGFASLLYVALKYSLRPGWLMALPLPPGLPSDTADLLILFAPLAISAMAALFTALWCRRKQFAVSIFPAFGLFVLADALMTLILYVPAVLRE